jgi:serine/threonine protein kinase
MNRKKEHNFYSEQELFYILQEFIYTFSQLQKQKISHRDIKPQNILVFKNVVNNENNVITHNTVLKIADFGEAKYKLQKQKDTITQTIRGTELYMSPILFCALKQKNVNNNKFIEHNSYKSDVYSLGLCFLLAASLSFNLLVEIRELDDMNIMKMMINNYIGKRYSKKFVNILYSMLEIDEKLRCDFNELNVKINFSEEE